jgi:uncharacterized protein YciW
VRRLTKDEHLGPEFATTWPTYDLDPKTRALLSYAKKLTEEPSMVEDADVEALRAAGWDEQGIYEATALISLLQLQRTDGSGYGAAHGRDPAREEGSIDIRQVSEPI